jgi:hypothetical protein
MAVGEPVKDNVERKPGLLPPANFSGQVALESTITQIRAGTAQAYACCTERMEQCGDQYQLELQQKNAEIARLTDIVEKQKTSRNNEIAILTELVEKQKTSRDNEIAGLREQIDLYKLRATDFEKQGKEKAAANKDLVECYKIMFKAAQAETKANAALYEKVLHEICSCHGSKETLRENCDQKLVDLYNKYMNLHTQHAEERTQQIQANSEANATLGAIAACNACAEQQGDHGSGLPKTVESMKVE